MQIIGEQTNTTLVNLPQLQSITFNSVLNTISTNAFVNLTSLKVLKITNNLEKIETDAFVIRSEDEDQVQEVSLDLSTNRLDESSFATAFIRLIPSLSVSLNLTGNRLRALPENVFRPFFEVNSVNRLQLLNNPFECGRCESYWIFGSLAKDRLSISCGKSSDKSVWDYDWSHCRNGANSANLFGLAVVIALAAQLMLPL